MPNWRLPEVVNLSGTGTIYDGDREIATVRYDLQVKHYKIIVQSSGGTSEHEGMKETAGDFSVIDGHIRPDAANVILELEDGRKLPIIIKSLLIPSGHGVFEGSGPFIED